MAKSSKPFKAAKPQAKAAPSKSVQMNAGKGAKARTGKSKSWTGSC